MKRKRLFQAVGFFIVGIALTPTFYIPGEQLVFSAMWGFAVGWLSYGVYVR